MPYLPGGGQRLQPGDDGNTDSSLAAFVPEGVEILVVEEHLGDDVVRAGIDFLLEVQYIRLDVRGLEMLLGIGSDSYAEALLKLPFPFVAPYRFHKLGCVAETSRHSFETLLSCDAISPEGQDIANAHKAKVLQLRPYLVGRIASADDVRHDFKLELFLDDAANSRLAHPPAHQMTTVGPVVQRPEFKFVPMVCDIDIWGIELHQRRNVPDEFVLGYAFERRYNFQRKEGFVLLGQYFTDFHSAILV